MEDIEDQTSFLFHPYYENDQPFDAENPEIEINVSSLKQRYDIACTKVKIKSQEGHFLFEGMHVEQEGSYGHFPLELVRKDPNSPIFVN